MMNVAATRFPFCAVAGFSGTIIKSSNKPGVGIKLGTKPIGVKRQSIVTAIIIFTVNSERLSLYALVKSAMLSLSALSFA